MGRAIGDGEVEHGAQVQGEPHWSEPTHDLGARVRWGFVVTSWLLALGCALVLATVLLVVNEAIQGDSLGDFAGVAIATSGLATFLSFFLVLRTRLPRVSNDRLLNSLATAGVHVVFALVLFAVAALLDTGLNNGELSLSWLPGDWDDRAGILFYSLERSSATAIAAALLAPGIIPATGDVPTSTQRRPRSTDTQL